MRDPDHAPDPAPAPNLAPPPPRKPRQLAADYRWTMPKLIAFLDALAKCGSIAEAARSVEMGRQSAYRLRARLEGTSLAPAFDGALRTGRKARAAQRAARNRSRWDGPGIAEFLAARARAQAALQRGAQGDGISRQGDTPAPQGDGFAAKGKNFPRTV